MHEEWSARYVVIALLKTLAMIPRRRVPPSKTKRRVSG
jgi:hypothetical protein